MQEIKHERPAGYTPPRKLTPEQAAEAKGRALALKLAAMNRKQRRAELARIRRSGTAKISK